VYGVERFNLVGDQPDQLQHDGLHSCRSRGRLRSQVSARCGMREPNTRASVKPRPGQSSL